MRAPSEQGARLMRLVAPLPAPPGYRSRRAWAAGRDERLLARRPRKLALIEAAIRRPKGASVAELIDLTGWQAHSIRGAISRELRKRRGIEVIYLNTEGRRGYYLKSAPRGGCLNSSLTYTSLRLRIFGRAAVNSHHTSRVVTPDRR